MKIEKLHKIYGTLEMGDVDKMDISWDFHCDCGHIAAGHWYVLGTGRLVTGRCHECPLDAERDVCKNFSPNNLLHLEKKAEAKDCK